jgi:NAD(P)-dependent dehydrogenase (short-subunit alcohol dehydrogenase family)
MGLHGRRVVVLGGASGPGLVTAKAAARCGAEVTVISRQPASVGRALAGLRRWMGNSPHCRRNAARWPQRWG